MKKVLPVLLVGVVALAAAGEAATAEMAGSSFATQMHKLDNAQLGTSQLQLQDVQVHRGLFSSTASADLAVVGLQTVKIPLVLHASQGWRPSGSALRVDITLGTIPDPQVQALLAKLHDEQPVVAHVNYGMDAKVRDVGLEIAPVHAVVDGRGTRIDWDGASGEMHSRGYFSGGGSANGQFQWTSMHLALPAPVSGQIAVGPIQETVQETGRLTNSTGEMTMNMGATTAIAQNKALRVDGFQADMHYALHRAESGYSDNPSGLPVGYVALKDFHLKGTISQPVSGTIQAAGSLQMPDLGSLLKPGMSAQQIQDANLEVLSQATGQVQLRVSMTLYRLAENPVLQHLAQAGFIEQQGQDAVSDIAVKNGHITINGHPLGA